MIHRQQSLAFIHNHIDSMTAHPNVWSGTQESFIVQLVLLVELSFLGKTKWVPRELMTALCGPGAGNTVPNGPITREWARSTCEIARRFVRGEVP